MELQGSTTAGIRKKKKPSMVELWGKMCLIHSADEEGWSCERLCEFERVWSVNGIST